MRYEVEVKYRVAGHSELAARLAAHGVEPGREVVHEDAFLVHPARDFARTNETLRLRRVGDEIRITYKGPRLRGPIKTREEIELPLGEGTEGFKRGLWLFRNLGFRPVVVIRKTRRLYSLTHQGRPIDVALDVAEGLGPFAEVETITETEADLPGAQSAVLDLAAHLGLTEIETRSYRRMALERRKKTIGNPTGKTFYLHKKHK
jgi:adenylate cyclase class 2